MNEIPCPKCAAPANHHSPDPDRGWYRCTICPWKQRIVEGVPVFYGQRKHKTARNSESWPPPHVIAYRALVCRLVATHSGYFDRVQDAHRYIRADEERDDQAYRVMPLKDDATGDSTSAYGLVEARHDWVLVKGGDSNV